MRNAAIGLILLVTIGPLGVMLAMLGTLQDFKTPEQVDATHVVIATIVPASASVPTVSAGSTGSVNELLAAARAWLGTPYQWGGCAHSGVDCSCYVQNVLATIGIHAPRVTTDQKAWAKPVARDDLRPFDLIFFDNTCRGCGANPTHVALWLGNNTFIHAGDPVQIQTLTGFYASHFSGAGRPQGL